MEIILQNLTNRSDNNSITGLRLFDSPIDIVLTLEFGHDIMILKIAEGRGTAYKSPQLLPSLYS